MTRSEKDAALNDLASKIFSVMLGEVIMDTALQVHKESSRSRVVCEICNTRCGQTHAGSATVAGTSQEASQTATQDTSSKSDGNVNLECVNCQRPIASNRYAQHLAQCLGVGTGVRRTLQRNAVVKTQMSSNGRSASPYVDAPIDGPEIKTSKSKAKAKGKQDEEQNGNQKRPGTPTISPAKKQKKGKANPPVPPVGTGPPSRLPGSQHRLAPPSSKPGSSRPRATPTPSVASHSSIPSLSKKSHSRSRSPSARSDSSEDSHYNTRSNASSAGSRADFSPTLPSAETIGRHVNRSKSANNKVLGTGPPVKRAPPVMPKLPSPIPRVLVPTPAPAPPRRTVDTSTYFVDIEGDETGSSSDTDSS